MEKPLKKQGFTLTEADDESIIYDSVTGKIHILNQVGAKIWDLCNGERTPEDIAIIIKEEFETDDDTALIDTNDFINQLKGLNLID